ncbi:MAG: galactose-1-phosphate uridylyltransferase [Deltaproteobacteria bacterium]|nr:galactose-1-phosphate uridylyltransferase [Candidatus Anaeroferrophillus wilburensis]MBN2889061.1 galactose-1-phosphate uridylyltransferase [Deltaproteobacteria bacterium]
MSELRKDPVTDRWVIIAKERGKRPSDFTDIVREEAGKGFCPFCPGNEDVVPPEVLAYRKPGSPPNGPGWRLRVVPNKFPALTDKEALEKHGNGMYDVMSGVGMHEVIIENPAHEATLSTMAVHEVEDVLWAYRDRLATLAADSRFSSVIIFKNQGMAAGATVQHSHSQLIALPIIPRQIKEELEGAKNYYTYKERCIFCDIVDQEHQQEKRVISENDEFIAVCPYAPRFPFEVWIIPKTHSAHYQETSKHDIESFSMMLSETLKRLDQVLDTPPYNFFLHSAPFRQDDSAYYHWHLEIIPKLTRIAGFEWGSGFYINPTPPEESAKFLRDAIITNKE